MVTRLGRGHPPASNPKNFLALKESERGCGGSRQKNERKFWGCLIKNLPERVGEKVSFLSDLESGRLRMLGLTQVAGLRRHAGDEFDQRAGDRHAELVLRGTVCALRH